MTRQELEELDLSVAKAEGLRGPWGSDHPQIGDGLGCLVDDECGSWSKYYPSRDPVEAMRLLEKYQLSLSKHRRDGRGASHLWYAWIKNKKHTGSGETPCIAICRAVVNLKKVLP